MIPTLSFRSSSKGSNSFKSLYKFAQSLGFIPDRQRGTSHLIFKKDGITVPILNKSGVIKPGLLSSIIKQLGSNRDEFIQFNI